MKKKEEEMKSRNRLMLLLFVGVLAGMTPQWAMASTAPCTQISNTATVAYKVGAVDQTPVTSAAANFYVGVKVIVTVTTQDGSNKSATPGTTPAVLEFNIANSGNAVQDYTLATEAAASGAASPHGGGNDSFDGTTIGVYVESGANAGYQAGEDTGTSIDNLAADTGQKTVYIIYTPSDLAAANGALAVYYLKATSKWANGDNITSGSGTPSAAQAGGACDGTRTVDVVYGDADGPSASEGSRDGVHSDDSAYIVSNATIGVSKSYSVVSDPINGTSSPKAIPGAVVRYSIAIANTGGASAILSTISDVLNANLQVVSTANNATWSVAASTRGIASGTLTADTNAGDGLAHSAPTNPAGTLTATLTTILVSQVGPPAYAAGELKAGETVTLSFDATIQ